MCVFRRLYEGRRRYVNVCFGYLLLFGLDTAWFRDEKDERSSLMSLDGKRVPSAGYQTKTPRHQHTHTLTCKESLLCTGMHNLDILFQLLLCRGIHNLDNPFPLFFFRPHFCNQCGQNYRTNQFHSTYVTKVYTLGQ